MTYTCLTRNRQNGTERMDHMKRVGFLTSGGDCQALNATMRGVAKGLYQIYQDEVEIIGFEDGYKDDAGPGRKRAGQGGADEAHLL